MSDGSMGDAGGGGGDFGSGYAGYGGGKFSSYLMAAVSIVGGVVVLIHFPSDWWLAGLFFLGAVFFIGMAHTRSRIQAWAKEKRRRKPGDPTTLYDLE